MNKKHFEDLDFAAVIVKEFYVFAKFTFDCDNHR